jgi:cytochrome c peroxidase
MSANRLLTVAALLVSGAVVCGASSGNGSWTAAELDDLRSLSITELEPLPGDPTNRVADDPRAVRLGERLFFDQTLSANGKVACGTCHQADRDFQDGIALGKGAGTTAKRTMPVAATSRAPFLFWDGRKDSQWAQALGPLESAVEHGGTRTQYAHIIAQRYRGEYEELFGTLPDLSSAPPFAGPNGNRSELAAWSALSEQQRDAITEVFVNIGKAIAAYERRIELGPSRFDRYVDEVTRGRPAEGILTSDEIAGLRLFIGKARCTQCHNGPLFTNNEFHNTGVPALAKLPVDDGRLTGAASVLKDEFNCRSRWSDARSRCAELEYLVTGDHTLDRAYKVPSLRNVAERAPFMDAGQFATLAAVLDHYNRAPKAPAGHTELTPLRMNRDELGQLEAFLKTLSGPVLVNRTLPKLEP